MESPRSAERLPGPPMRRWRPDDLDSLATLADDWEVAKNLRDAFPHPYTREHARAWIEKSTSGEIPQVFAIECDGAAVGGCGLRLHEDIERCSAEIGYWVGRPFWGRGLASAAVRAVTEHAFRHLGLLRVYALPFEENAASARVLEKAGYLREGLLRHAAIKAGRPRNMVMYAITRDP